MLKTHFVHLKFESFSFIKKIYINIFLIKYLDNKEHNLKTYYVCTTSIVNKNWIQFFLFTNNHQHLCNILNKYILQKLKFHEKPTTQQDLYYFSCVHFKLSHWKSNTEQMYNTYLPVLEQHKNSVSYQESLTNSRQRIQVTTLWF